MAKPLPSWLDRARQMKPFEAIVVETAAPTQHVIIQHLRKLDGKFTTRRIPGGFRVERLPLKE